MHTPLPNPLVVMALEEESGDHFRSSSIPVLYTGVGKINAAYFLTRKLSEYEHVGQSLPVVVNFGTAGSRLFPVGSIVACSAFVQRDMDVTALGFDVGTTPFDLAPPILEFPLILANLPPAICGTGDSFSTTHAGEQCSVVDMEAFSLAKVCWLYGVKFISIKCITDGANPGAGAAWRENIDKAARCFVEVYEKIISESQHDSAGT